MKYLITGLALILAVCAFCAINGAVFDSRMGEIDALAGEACRLLDAGDADGALRTLRTASQLFDDNAGYFTAILLHSNADAAQMRLHTALRMLESGSPGDTLPTAHESIKSLRDGERLSFGNVF